MLNKSLAFRINAELTLEKIQDTCRRNERGVSPQVRCKPLLLE
jgi:hypothetical protein